MAAAKLNFNEEFIKQQESLYSLYSRLYEGMKRANQVDSPAFDVNPPLLPDGSIDTGTIELKIAEYSDILMKNSAYLYAHSIIEVIGTGGGSGGSSGGDGNYVSKSGDSMEGGLAAMYGFDTGYNGERIFEVFIDGDEVKWAEVTGHLSVSKNIYVDGHIEAGDEGIWFGPNKALWWNIDTLTLTNEKIALEGKVYVDGSISAGQTTINDAGIFWGDNEYYHSGNSNNNTADWSTKDAYVYGNLQVNGNTLLQGAFKSTGGFSLEASGDKLIYSRDVEELNSTGQVIHRTSIALNSDLHIINGHGVKFDDAYIVKVRGGSDNVVSFSAPGKVMNLGDSDNGVKTQFIALQSAIKNDTGVFNIITPNGDGNFPNSFSAGSGNAGVSLIQTYYISEKDQGVISAKNLRFGTSAGPAIYSENGTTLSGHIPYIYTSGARARKEMRWNMSFEATTSLFRDLSLTDSASLHIGTDGEFIVFDNRIESSGYIIKSERYKTILTENALLFSDGAFLEGVVDGVRYAGNSYFYGNISSPRFASGFAGYGFGILHDLATGDYNGTLDGLTIRKKFRAYEFEVQKVSATNGSLWVSDSCSGDEVRAIV